MQASGAKFNTGKTEILPIGSHNHRAKMCITHKLNNAEQHPQANSIRFIEDKEAMRVLGVWIRNNINISEPWEPVLDKIQCSLEHFSKGYPTLKGCKMIAQMIISRCTQFLTKAQGMPIRIEEVLMEMIRNFMWEEST